MAVEEDCLVDFVVGCGVEPGEDYGVGVFTRGQELRLCAEVIAVSTQEGRSLIALAGEFGARGDGFEGHELGKAVDHFICDQVRESPGLR